MEKQTNAVESAQFARAKTLTQKLAWLFICGSVLFFWFGVNDLYNILRKSHVQGRVSSAVAMCLFSTNKTLFKRSRGRFVLCTDEQGIRSLLETGWHRTIRQVQLLKINFSGKNGVKSEIEIQTYIDDKNYKLGDSIGLLLDSDGTSAELAPSVYGMVFSFIWMFVTAALAYFVAKFGPKKIKRHL
jgi:hypothetical protein